MKTFFIVVAVIIGYFIIMNILLKGKNKNPDKRLLRIDDKFTSTVSSTNTDAEKKVIYKKLADELDNTTGLSIEDEGYRKRLISILESRIDNN